MAQEDSNPLSEQSLATITLDDVSPDEATSPDSSDSGRLTGDLSASWTCPDCAINECMKHGCDHCNESKRPCDMSPLGPSGEWIQEMSCATCTASGCACTRSERRAVWGAPPPPTNAIRATTTVADMPDRVPVLIAGGGPTGLTTALYLQRMGVDFLCLERDTAIVSKAKGQALSIRTMEMLQGVGILPNVLAKRTVHGVPMRHIYMDGADGTRKLAEIPLPGMSPTPYSASHGVRLPQNLLQEAVWEGVRDAGGADKVHFGWEVVSTDAASDHVDVTIRSTRTGETHQVVAEYVVGADGATSSVRKQIGENLAGDAAIMPVLAFEVESRELQQRLFRHGEACMVSVVGGESGFRAICSLTFSDTIFHINVMGPGAAAVDVDDPEAARELLHTALELEGECDICIMAVYRWHVHKMFSSAFHDSLNRIFLVGDAAHLIPPAAGLNMNVGIEDAGNLAWKLGAVIQGWAPRSLLDTYELERQPWASNTADRSAHMTRVMGPIQRDFPPRKHPQEFQEALRDLWAGKGGLDLDIRYDNSPLVVPDSRVTAEEWDCGKIVPMVRAGHRPPHVELSDGQSLPLTLPRGTSFVLLVADQSGMANASALAEAAQAENVPLVTVDVCNEPTVAPVYGALTLIRPDAIIAWTSVGGAGDEPIEADRIMRTVVGV